MSFLLDLDDVLSGTEELEPGIYTAVIAKVDNRESKKGEKYLNITFSIKGRYVYLPLFLWSENENNRVRSRRMLKALCDAIKLPQKGKVSAEELVGKRVQVSVRTYNGQAEISSFLSSDESGAF